MKKAPAKISIIIPTYNEERYIGKTIEHLQKHFPEEELIVVDGNSEDKTREIIKNRYPEVQLIHLREKGRGKQMNAGVSYSKGHLLFFLHADTFPPPNGRESILQVFKDKKVVAASFYLKFDQNTWPYRILSFFSRWNTSFTTYGDQGLIVRRAVFEQINGFHSFPIFEDIEIQGRLRKIGRFVKINSPVTTSARRFQKKGLLRQLLLNAGLVLSWKMGIPPEKLGKYYTYHQSN
jgi:rSAM/selenodomain-associated transferase 2